MLKVIPKPGAHVRDPETKKLLGPEGIKIELMNTYWHRRVKDGTVTVEEIKKKQGE